MVNVYFIIFFVISTQRAVRHIFHKPFVEMKDIIQQYEEKGEKYDYPDDWEYFNTIDVLQIMNYNSHFILVWVSYSSP